MYSIEYSQRAVKELKKLEPKVARRIVSALERIRIRPHSFVVKLVGTDYYRLKVDRYRVILAIKEKKLTILVIRVGHRKNIYK